jgi:hypothetical protein
MEFKVLLCPLVSSDFRRAKRAIQSCLNQKNFQIQYDIHVVINSLDKIFVSQIENYCLENSIKYSITVSDGTASTGKNSVFDVFNRTDYSHLCQLDGDDFFYPTFLLQIQRHLNKFKTTDVLACLPFDRIFEHEKPNSYKLKNGYYAEIWGTNYDLYEPARVLGEDSIFMSNSIGNYARIILFSKKVSQNFRYDSEYKVGEDRKLHFELLHAYQKDEICYWFTSASDTSVKDTSSFGVQKKYSGVNYNGVVFIVEDEKTTENLKKFIEETMYRERSAPGEIPIDFAPIYMLHNEKYEYLEKTI